MAVSIRKAEPRDAPAIARVGVDAWRSTYSGIVPEEFLANLSYTSREERLNATLADPQSKTTVFVAEAESKGIAGFAGCGPERTNDPDYEGELYMIYVVRAMQRKGIGMQLVASVVGELRARGLDSMLVWVLERNPSRRFYKAIGGEQVRTKEVVIGGRPLIEVGYGWKNLDSWLEILEDRRRRV